MDIQGLKPNRALKSLIDSFPKDQLAPKLAPKILEEDQISPVEIEIIDNLLEVYTSVSKSNPNADQQPQESVDNEGLVKFSIRAKDVEECPAIDLVAVIDRSGSMGAECSALGEDGLEKKNGFSVMDIVKHALNTVIKTLRPQDRLALVVFDHEVEILFTLSEMTE